MNAPYIESHYTFVRDVSDTEKKLIKFLSLPEGWHFGEGKSASEAVYDAALDLYRAMQKLNFDDTDTFPGVNGEILLEMYFGDDTLEFTIQPDTSVIFKQETHNKCVKYIKGLSQEEAKTILRNFWASRTWNLSDLSVKPSIGQAEGEDSQAQRSKTFAAHIRSSLAECPLLVDNASWIRVGKSASTFVNIIQTTKRKERLSSGASRQ
jgi:hypothetical protein